ncbi:MAG: hypothetical protein ABIN68_00585 [Sphingomicrobium sp.]
MPLVFLALAPATVSTPAENIPVATSRPCDARRPISEEIVVCARRGDGSSPYRIKPIKLPSSGLPKAEMALGNGVSVSAETESSDVGGFPSNRAMVRLKIKF